MVWRAARRLGIPAQAAVPAAQAGLLELGARVRFRHPLVRSAAYRSASLHDRRAVHRALAEVTDPLLHPDRRAWHLAQAAPGPDEQVAADLERSAGRAQVRGGLAAAAAFLGRAAALTPDPARRADRALAAAGAKVQAGALDGTLEMLDLAAAGAPDQLRQARADLVRAQHASVSNRGREAPPLLLRAARRLEGIDAGLARAAYLDAMTAAMSAGRLAVPGAGALEVARAAACGAAASAPAARVRSSPGWPGRPLQHGISGWSADSAAGAERLRPHDGRGGGASLAGAGMHRGPASVG